jgi:plasmid stabilization system protein ParE
MKVRYSARSLAELENLLRYVSTDAPDVAVAIAASVEDKIASCAKQPLLGARTDKANIYRYPIKKYRLTIFYRVRLRKKELEVLRIVRGSRVKRLRTLP